MKQFFRKLLKYLAYLGAGLVILLAVAVGLFRLLLPKLPAYQEEIKNWANAAIGMQVEFSGMDARWRLSGPELTFYDAEFVTDGRPSTVLHAEEVSVGVELLRLLLDFELVADRILIRESQVDIRQQQDGSWHVQGLPVGELPEAPMAKSGAAGALVVIGEDIDVDVTFAHRSQPISVGIESLQFRRTRDEHSVDAIVVLAEEFGASLDLAASRRLTAPAAENPWRLYVEGSSLNVARLARLWPEVPQLASGLADVELWVELANARVRSATANFAVADVVVGPAEGGPPAAPDAPFSAEGRVEYSRGAEGWLLAADEFAMTTAGGEWPASSLTLRVSSGNPGEVERVKGSASYLNFNDLHYVSALLPGSFQKTLGELQLSGVVRGLDVTVMDPASPSRRFSGSARLERAGIAAWRGWPGLRGFSGSVRTDQSGGRVEIDAADMLFSLPAWFAEPIAVGEAAGTVIWRQSDLGTTVLSDSVRVRNSDLDSQSSLQVTLPAGGGSPVVDLQSRWNARSIAVIENYLPVKVMTPGVYAWLRDALVAGQITAATTRLSGPLDQFPFEDGEGTFHTEAHVRDANLRYAASWPDVENIEVELVIDGTRLYSVENSATSAGNRVVDARVEIPDLRSPVLLTDLRATGTLDSIRTFARQSPIDSLFGGHLERVEVEGDVAFQLELSYPIRRRQDYAFSTTIRSDNGTVDIEGMPAPLTAIGGEVTVTRDTIRSDALVGRFMGGPITIDLARAGDAQPSYSVIARARGSMDAEGLIEGLALPLGDRLHGNTTFDATVSFPQPGLEDPVPLEIMIESDLDGMALDVPQPLGKAAGTVRRLSVGITLPQQGQIASFGRLSDAVRWTVGFERTADGWDFDRGVVALGGALPGDAESRGLHIEGRTPRLDVDEWLELAKAGAAGPGFGDRIRSIDVVADDLRVIGQHLSRHRMLVDRSAFHWVVQLEGADIVGSVMVPYDFTAARPIELEMQRLVLPGGDDASEVSPLGDPRTLPPIVVQADEFSLGNRHFGSLKAEFLRTGRGLVADTIETSSTTFGIIGSAGWVVDEVDPAGQRTFVSARLTSSNVQQTMQQLDYQPGIESEEMDVTLDVSWSGGPRQDFLASLDGNVGVRFGAGQLDEIEPGAGRVFGLMSIVALPRRLSLDFSDVFDRGFGFDEITGNFRLVDGQAYTCDLSLKGPAADVGIVGRTGLVTKVYEQTAVVSANVGNTLPVVGAVVAGPQVAAALLIFSQIFKKPLQEMGQIYYGIDGTWEDPAVDVVNAQRFAQVSTLAGCLADAGA